MDQTATSSLTVVPVAERGGLLSLATWSVSLAGLTALAAQLTIPMQPVPLTLQTFVVLLSGLMLGRKGGAASQGIYLLAGLAGVPVFAGWSFGPAHLLGPTGGYLLSFPAAAWVAGAIVRRQTSLPWFLLGALAGEAVIVLLGIVQLQFVYTHNWSAAISAGWLVFSWWDGVKLLGAAVIARRVRTIIG